MTDNALGEFLRSRRERISPDQLGLRAVGSRRTPGLRREEVASAAGISVEYLIRLERGRDRNPSPQVIGALANVLAFDVDALAYVQALALPNGVHKPRLSAEVPAALRDTIARGPDPTVISNRYLDLLGYNDLGAEVHKGFGLKVGVNMVRHTFDPQSRAIYRDWDAIAAESVANLRSLAGVTPHDPRLIELVGELSLSSEAFAQLWAHNDVAIKTTGQKAVQHSEFGEIELLWSTLMVPASDLIIIAYRAAANSATAAVLDTLRNRLASAAHALN